MASYPPYPPPGSPWGYDPKQQARIARQQVKFQVQAQKAAFRAQRDLYRYQNRSFRRSSILAPLIILAIGVVILLIRLGRIPYTEFWAWYGHWWPVLLVGAGVILVAEWAFDQIPREDGTPYVRRGIGGGAIFLLLCLALAGVSVHEMHDGRDFFAHNLNFDPDAFDEFFGSKHEMTQPVEAAFPVGSSLSIDNPHGDVTIIGKSDDDKVHVTVNKQVWSQSDSDADAKAQQLSPHIAMIGNTLSITLAALSGSTSDLSITMPDFGETTVNANHGAVNVSGMHAPVTITANHGDVELNSIKGSVSAHINHGGSSFTAHQVDGDVTVRGHADDMSVTDVTGHVSFEGEFNGDTHLEHLRGPMSFRTSRTQFSLERLDGEVDISPRADLSGSEIVGPTSLRTRSRNVKLDRLTGDVDVTDSDGSVDLTSAPPLGNVSITNKNGEVNVTVPERAGFSIDAETRGGEIENDLDLKSSNQNNRSAIQGTIAGGGPTITIRTTHLDIGIHKKPELPLAPPAPPAPPVAPKAVAPAKPRV